MYIGDVDRESLLNKNNKGTRQSVLMLTRLKPVREKTM